MKVVRGDEMWPYLRPFSKHVQTEVARRISTDLPVPVDAPTSGIGLCVGDAGERPVALAPADTRYHAHLVGPSGSGKSWALAGWALDAVQDPRMAVVVVDPKDGLLIEDIMGRLPRNAWERVRLIAPAEGDRTVGLNPLEAADESMRSVIADRLVDVLHGLYRNAWGPRAAHVVRAGALTVLGQGGTLCDLADVLVDDEAAAPYLRGLDDPGLDAFWEDWRGLSEAERQKQAGSALWKLRELTLSAPVRQLLGQRRSTIDLEEVLDAGGILLVSLPSGRLGRELSHLVGALVVARIWQTAQARAGRPDEARPPVTMLLDEFQNVVSLGPIDEVLVEARSYNLGLVLAHQHLGQLPDSTAAAAYANCRTRMAFQPSDEHEAKRLCAFYPGLKAETLLALRRHQVAARVCIGGRSSQTFTGYTRPLPDLPQLPGEDDLGARHPDAPSIRARHAAELRDLALERWGRDRAEVDDELRRRRRGSHDDTGGLRL